tara:strand:- start:4091 stop:4315 length:225 start_codon:yes stop_codon:yes gene_type:complete
MDNKINEFNLLIEEKKDNYKNVCLLWKNWIKVKKQRLDNELDIAIQQIKNIENYIENDISIDNLIILSLLRDLQ